MGNYELIDVKGGTAASNETSMLDKVGTTYYEESKDGDESKMGAQRWVCSIRRRHHPSLHGYTVAFDPCIRLRCLLQRGVLTVRWFVGVHGGRAARRLVFPGAFASAAVLPCLHGCVTVIIQMT